MNTRPHTEVLDHIPNSQISGRDFPQINRLGKLLDSYADNLLEPHSSKVVLISELRYTRN